MLVEVDVQQAECILIRECRFQCLIEIGFGLDLMHYEGDYYGYYGWYWQCNRNPGGCPGWYTGYDTSFWSIHIPVVMQWNFWLSEHWSVFAEPGISLRLRDDFRDRGPDLTIYGGGRYRFGQAVALTMRIGHPAISLGFSFFL